MRQTVHTFNELCTAVRYAGDRPRTSASATTESTRDTADVIARICATALQVTYRTVPLIHRACERVAERLGLPDTPEAYIIADPTPNAFAPAWSVGQRPFFVLHSGIVQLLSATEIECVIGHELGHLGMRHGRMFDDVPMSEDEASRARMLQRAAEISADRVGLLACRSVHHAARVMIKLASGLPSELLGFDIDAFIGQMEHDPAAVSRDWDLDLSHPSLPLRLWSLLRFGHTDTYARLSGQGASGASLQEIDAEIEARLNVTVDGAISSIDEDIYQKALMWAGLYLVMSGNVIQPSEHEALIRLVGNDLAAKAVTYATSHGRDAVQSKYNEAVRRLEVASPELLLRFRTAEQAFRSTVDVERPM